MRHEVGGKTPKGWHDYRKNQYLSKEPRRGDMIIEKNQYQPKEPRRGGIICVVDNATPTGHSRQAMLTKDLFFKNAVSNSSSPERAKYVSDGQRPS